MAKFSYSRLECYNQCGWKYKLQYEDGLYIFQPNLAAAYGTLVHSVLEKILHTLKKGEKVDYDTLRYDFVNINLPKKNKYDRNELFGTKILAEKFPEEWRSFDSKSGMSYEMKAQEFMNIGIYEFENYMNEHPELEIVGAEIGFEFEYKGYVFTGFIDRLLKYKDENKFQIFDIKTKDTPYDDKELVTPLQFVVYAQALRKMYGEDIEVECFYDLPTCHLIQPAGTKGFEKRGLTKMDKLFAGIGNKDWHPSPSPLCKWCQFSMTNPNITEEGKFKCPYYSLWSRDNPTFEKLFEWQGIEKHDEVMQRFMAKAEIGTHSDPFWDFDF